MQISSVASDIFTRSVRRRMWRDSIIIALVIFSLLLIYVYLQKGGLTVRSVNEVIAAAGSVMIGFSFAMSGLCYYFNFLDRQIAYRKYLGLIGFWLAFIYAIGLVLLNPEQYFYGFWMNFFTPDIILGLVALEIFAFMTVTSTDWAMRKMGIVNWRRVMRLGYLAYGLLIIRAALMEGNQWFLWLTSLNGLPPLRLIGSAFALAVLLWRGSIIISQRFTKSKPRRLQLEDASL